MGDVGYVPTHGEGFTRRQQNFGIIHCMEAPGTNPLLAQMKRELRIGERLLWAGQPDPAPLFRKSFAIYLFAIPWTAFSLFWEIMALSGWLSGRPPTGIVELGAGIIMPIFGLPFVMIGLGMLSVPLWVMRGARQTLYGITESRAVALTAGRRLKVRSVDGKSMGPVTRTEGKNGRGTLSIETGSHRDSDGDRVTDKFDFNEIEDVARVEELIRRLKESPAA